MGLGVALEEREALGDFEGRVEAVVVAHSLPPPPPPPLPPLLLLGEGSSPVPDALALEVREGEGQGEAEGARAVGVCVTLPEMLTVTGPVGMEEG